MAKIILMEAGRELRTVILSKERITLGRRPENDIVIDELVVSGQHAAIVTVAGKSRLDDLNSTNGTRINGQSVKTHVLQENDMIELAQYQLTFVSDPPVFVPEPPAVIAQSVTGASSQLASITIVSGSGEGQQLVLRKALTTIGKPGVQTAVITRGYHGYSIIHLEGDTYPLVNGVSIGTGRRSMKDGDVIELVGSTMTFLVGAIT